MKPPADLIDSSDHSCRPYCVWLSQCCQPFLTGGACSVTVILSIVAPVVTPLPVLPASTSVSSCIRCAVSKLRASNSVLPLIAHQSTLLTYSVAISNFADTFACGYFAVSANAINC